MATHATEEQLRREQEWAELPEVQESGELGAGALADLVQNTYSDHSTDSEHEDDTNEEVTTLGETDVEGPQEVNLDGWQDVFQSGEHEFRMDPDVLQLFRESFEAIAVNLNAELAVADQGQGLVRLRFNTIANVVHMPARSTSNELIASLPRTKFADYTKEKDGEEIDSECHICLLDYESDEPVIELKCKHYFHEECIVRWLKERQTCPKCRTVVKKE